MFVFLSKFLPTFVYPAGLIFLLVLLFSAFVPAAAGPLAAPGPAQDVTPLPTVVGPDPALTVIVPDTGGDADGAGGVSWLLWVILFVIVLALIIGLMARPRTL